MTTSRRNTLLITACAVASLSLMAASAEARPNSIIGGTPPPIPDCTCVAGTITYTWNDNFGCEEEHCDAPGTILPPGGITSRNCTPKNGLTGTWNTWNYSADPALCGFPGRVPLFGTSSTQ